MDCGFLFQFICIFSFDFDLVFNPELVIIFSIFCNFLIKQKVRRNTHEQGFHTKVHENNAESQMLKGVKPLVVTII